MRAVVGAAVPPGADAHEVAEQLRAVLASETWSNISWSRGRVRLERVGLVGASSHAAGAAQAATELAACGVPLGPLTVDCHGPRPRAA